MSRYVRLTKEIAIEDILNGNVSYVDAHKSQITEWILNPCRELDSGKGRNTDYGMAIWVLLLSFFESHGQYLTNVDSNGQSQKIFKVGFDAFKNFLIQKQLVKQDIQNLDTSKLYEFARSGLFHSAVMYKDFLLDCINYSKNSISKNPIHGGWLINLWLLTENLSGYVDFYVEQVKTDEQIKNNFESTFKRLVVEPMKKIIANL